MSSSSEEKPTAEGTPALEEPRVDAVLTDSKDSTANENENTASPSGGAPPEESIEKPTEDTGTQSSQSDASKPSQEADIAAGAKRPPSPTGAKPANKRVKGSLDGYFTKKPAAASSSGAAPKASSSGSSPGPSTGIVGKVTVEDLETTTLAIDWRKALQAEFTKPYFVKLKSFIQTEFKTHTIYPAAKDVYSWSRLTRLEAVKVVIIGQDPYHGPGQAHGLSFSVRDPVVPPPSLKNIYKQLAEDIPGFKIPKSGDLTATARQGVLWLNTSLTVRSGQAASHSGKGWETFTAAVLKAVLARKFSKGVVFLCWGAHASKVCKGLGIDKTRHLVLESAHPSPLSASKGFLGNQHFKKTNEWLKKIHGEGEEIDWTVLNPATAT